MITGKKIKNKISDLNTNIPIIILNVNALNTNIKRQRLVDFFLNDLNYTLFATEKQ